MKSENGFTKAAMCPSFPDRLSRIRKISKQKKSGQRGATQNPDNFTLKEKETTMKSYIRNHILSSFIMFALATGGVHFLLSSLQSQSAGQQAEIEALMQEQPQNADGAPTLGQIGQNLGSFFRSVTP